MYDKVVTVLQLFKRHGRKGLIERGDWPNYVETIRPVYEPEELHAMFRACTEDEATLLKFVLGSGFRDQEIRHAEWRDIDFRNELVRVTAKPEVGLHAEELGGANCSAPTVLMDRLRKRKESRRATPNNLYFPTAGPAGQRNGHDRQTRCPARRAELRTGARRSTKTSAPKARTA